ncbi:hypothetical protein HanRHA438_Chr07g0307881 [Helianthus annuus]|nr:hypothetical protein HanRHA438_Chr07g0307881 [Helianthus annuus]
MKSLYINYSDLYIILLDASTPPLHHFVQKAPNHSKYTLFHSYLIYNCTYQYRTHPSTIRRDH